LFCLKFKSFFLRKFFKLLQIALFVDCVVYLEGSITKVTSKDVGIYISREYQPKIKDLQGRRVKILVIVDDCKEGSTH
jgi:hypothetical protein